MGAFATGFIDFSAFQSGTSVPAVNQGTLGRIVIGLPPLAEQRRIVAKVESLFAQTALETKLRQAQADIVTVNRAALNRLSVAADDDTFGPRGPRSATPSICSTTTRATWPSCARRSSNWRCRASSSAGAGRRAGERAAQAHPAEKRRLVKEGKIKEEKGLLVVDSKQAPYPLPIGWIWSHFADIATIATDSTDPDEFPDLPHIAPDNIEKSTGRLLGYRSVSEDEVRSVNHHFFPGQILYSKIRPNLSKAALVDFEGLCSADMYPLDSYIDSRFLLNFILSSTFLQMVTKSSTRVAMPKVNQEQLSKIPVAVPPLAEQHRIVAKVDQLMRQCDALAAGLARARGSGGRSPRRRCTARSGRWWFSVMLSGLTTRFRYSNTPAKHLRGTGCLVAPLPSA